MGVLHEVVIGPIEESIGEARRLVEHSLVACQSERFHPHRATVRRATTMTIVAGNSSSSSVDGVGQMQDRIETANDPADQSEAFLQTYRDAKTAEVVQDIRNVLNVISMLTELTLLKLPDASAANESVRNIKSACADANNLCTQIMDDARQARKDVERVDLSTLVMALSPLLTAYVPAKSTLRFELIESTPLATVSPGGVRQILMNLVKNAAEALGDQPGYVTVGTGSVELDRTRAVKSESQFSTRARKYSYLAVTDTGCGMDESTRSRLFEQSFTTKSDGHGLGMASVRRIVDGCGGLIQVCSQVGYGTHIRILFPQCN